MEETVTFVSQKINKVRWNPTTSTILKSQSFATGSYEEKTNSIAIWNLRHPKKSGNIDLLDMTDIESGQPRRICEHTLNGDVRGMEFAEPDVLVVGLGSGDVCLLKVVSKAIETQCAWKGLHKFGGSTDVAAALPELVSVGEDGSIHVLRVDTKSPLRTFAHQDSCPITCVQYLNTHDVCTTNTMGQLRLWDVRSSSDNPSRVMVSSETLCALNCVDHHPTQNHILAAGGSDGCVTLFDVRKGNAPVTSLQIHDEDIWEIHFHEASPSFLFTCSEDASVRRINDSFELNKLSLGASPLNVTEILSDCGLSVNSLDVNGSGLVCSTDAESLYLVEDVL